MNTHRIKLLLAVLSICCFFNTGAQTYTSGNLTTIVTDSITHDSTRCTSYCYVYYNITKTGSFMGDTLRVVDTSTGDLVYSVVNTTGVNPWTWTTPMFYSELTDEAIPVGGGMAPFGFRTVKVVSGSDTIHSIAHSYPFYVGNPCQYGTVTGIVYVDNNSDCVYNTGDVWIDPSYVGGIAYLSGPVPSVNNTSMSWGIGGYYSFPLQQSWMTYCTTSMPPYFSFIFPPSSCSSGTYNFTTLPQSNIDFPLQSTSRVDVECWTGSPENARPNRPFFMHPYVSNLGYDTISGQLTLIKDSRVAYDATLSTYPADTVHGDTLIWNYYNLTSIATGAYWNNFMSSIYLTPNTSVNIGDTLCFHIFTGVPPTDINPANNDYMVCLPVVNSYDPNVKEVSPKGDGPLGEIGASTPELTYTIYFQNTGTDVAYDINVVDTLSPNVDASSLKILGTSHSMFPEWIAPGVVKFKFSNIYLADSFSNEPASHGYVRFKVNMHAGLAPGTQIKNKGYIYFDLNPAVITNEALNTIVHTTAVNNVAINNVKVYPNPASDAIFVENLQDGNISILSMNGAVVLNQNITNNKTEINIDRLPAGVYILKTVSKDGATTRKFVKQ